MRILFSRLRTRLLSNSFKGIAPPPVLWELKRRNQSLDLLQQPAEMVLLEAHFKMRFEMLPAEDVFRLSNQALEAFSEAVFDEMGIIPDFSFTNMRACFGFPLAQEDDASRACRTALRLHTVHDALTEGWREHGQTGFELQLGVHRGGVWPAFIGHTLRPRLAMIGQDVNLTGALPQVCKRIGGVIVISKAVQERLAPGFQCRELGRFRFKGLTKPVTLFELHAPRKEDQRTPEAVGTHFRRYEAALALYYQGRFSEARDAFRLNGGDLAAVQMAQICEGLIKAPPREPWDGVGQLSFA